MYVALDPIGSSPKPKKTNTQALAAIAEKRRIQKVQEYREFMNSVKKVSSDIVSSSDELMTINKMLDNCMNGEFANSIKNMAYGLQGPIGEVINNLNSIGTRAAQQVEKEGEPCTYDNQQTHLVTAYNGNNKTTFSCNTDVLRKQVLPHLQALKKHLEKTTTTISNLPRLEGCEDIGPVSDIIKGILDSTKKIFTKTEEIVENVERIEKENFGIAEGLGEAFLVAARTSAFRILTELPKQVFSKDITYKVTITTETTETTEKELTTIKAYYTAVPTTTSPEDKVEHVMILLDGAGRFDIEAHKMIDTIMNSDLDKPFAILVEPKIDLSSDSNRWIRIYDKDKNAINDLKMIIDDANNKYGLSREDTTYTLIRI